MFAIENTKLYKDNHEFESVRGFLSVLINPEHLDNIKEFFAKSKFHHLEIADYKRSRLKNYENICSVLEFLITECFQRNIDAQTSEK